MKCKHCEKEVIPTFNLIMCLVVAFIMGLFVHIISCNDFGFC